MEVGVNEAAAPERERERCDRIEFMAKILLPQPNPALNQLKAYPLLTNFNPFWKIAYQSLKNFLTFLAIG